MDVDAELDDRGGDSGDPNPNELRGELVGVVESSMCVNRLEIGLVFVLAFVLVLLGLILVLLRGDES